MSVQVANTASALSGKTLLTGEASETITGLKTFDRDPAAPFAVSASSAVVTNLDADKLDGAEGSAYAKLASNQTFSGINTFGKYIASTPASITGPDDIDIGDALICIYTSGGAPTGFAGGVNGRILILINQSGGSFVLENEDTGSAADNRIADTVGVTDLIPDGGGVMLVYLTDDNRWHVIAPRMT